MNMKEMKTENGTEKKEDRRVRRTKKLLSQGLIELMQHKQVKDITVRELAERVDVNRGTFYLYYRDIFDLLERLEEDLFEQLNEVISRTGVPYSYQQLTKMVQAEAVNSTEVFSIDVTSPDPQEAELIANAIADILPDRIADIVEGSSVKIVDYAIVPAEIASPSYTRNTALGMLVGLVIIAAIICLREIFDEKLHSEDDITQRYQLPILAVIPDLAYSGAGAYRSDYEPAKKEKTT